MLINLFSTVRNYGVPATLKEFLDLLKALDKNLAFANWDDFYYLSRTILVKDEKYFDKFDRAFDIFFKGGGLGFFSMVEAQTTNFISSRHGTKVYDM